MSNFDLAKNLLVHFKMTDRHTKVRALRLFVIKAPG